jgi:hypothetical protein
MKSGAQPVEIIVGCRQVRPSKKAKAAAGIYSDDKESEPDADNVGPSKAGTKRKFKGLKDHANSHNKKIRTKEAPKKTQACKNTTNSNDPLNAEDTGDANDDEDEADAYEQLRVERENDRPVSDAVT